MSTKKYKQIEDKLAEFEKKIEDMKAKAYGHLSMRDDLDALIRDMEQIRDKISSQMKNSHDTNGHAWDEIEKNIYKDIETFNRAFRKAGEFFKQ